MGTITERHALSTKFLLIRIDIFIAAEILQIYKVFLAVGVGNIAGCGRTTWKFLQFFIK